MLKIPLYGLRSRPAKAFDSSVCLSAMCALRLKTDLHSRKLLENSALWIADTEVASVFRSPTQKRPEEPVTIRLFLNVYIWCKPEGDSLALREMCQQKKKKNRMRGEQTLHLYCTWCYLLC